MTLIILTLGLDMSHINGLVLSMIFRQSTYKVDHLYAPYSCDYILIGLLSFFTVSPDGEAVGAG